MRQLIAKLDAIESDPEVDRLRQKQEESDLLTRRKDELESRLSTLETEYEELLGTRHWFRSMHSD